MKLPVLNAEGKQVRQVEVDDTVFGLAPNAAVLHQTFVAQRANQRWGSHQTKTRGEVQGSTRKLRGQKYTGRARQGSARAPHRVGGGTAFGPRLRDYSQDLPKKMRRLAIRSALSGKVAHGQLVVIDGLSFARPKTKEIVRILHNVGIQRSTLIVTSQPDRTVLTSARNLQKTKVLPAAYLNVLDMLNYRHLLMTVDALRVAEGLWGRRVTPPPAETAAPPKRRRAPKAEGSVEEAPAPAAAAEAAVARKAAAARPAQRTRRRPAPAPPEPVAAKPARRSRRTAAAAPPEPVAEKPARRTRRTPAPTPPETAAPPKGRRAPKAAAPAQEAPAPKAAVEALAPPEPVAEKPARRTRRTPAPAPPEPVAEKPERRTRRTPAAAPPEPQADAPPSGRQRARKAQPEGEEA